MSRVWIPRRDGTAVALVSGIAAVAGRNAMAQAMGANSAMTVSLVDAAAVAALVLASGIAILALLSRRLARATAERDVLAEALRAAGGCQLVTDADGRAVAAGTAWRDLAGYDPDAPLAHFAEGVLTAAEGELDRLRRIAADGDDASTLLRSSRSGEAYCWLHARSLDRKSGHVIWTLDDGQLITESSRLAELAGDDTTGAYVADQDGRLLYADKTFAGWFGLDPGDLVVVGTILRDLLADEGGPADPLDAPTGRRVFKRPDGSTFEACFAQSVQRERNGSGFHTRTLVRDLSAFRSMREAADQAESRVRRIFGEAPIGIAMLDAAGGIVEGNETFARLMGVGAAAADDRRVASLFVEDDRPGLEAWLGRASSGDGRLVSHEAQPVSGDTALQLFAGRFGDRPEDGLIVYVLGPPESRNVDAQLLQSQKMELVGQLAGGVAHDFNNLLTAMIGFCDLLLLRHNPKDPSFSDITQIKQNANRAASLVRQLLAFSRQQTLQPRVLNLTDVLDELKHLLRRLMGANIEFDIIHGRDIGLVKADQSQLEQVIINLAVNARDAMPDGGALTIRTGCVMKDDPEVTSRSELGANDYVTIEVADTGVGIPDHLLEKIYEPFFTTKDVGAGTGLGLATVYGIIKQTGGYIFVKSETGKGTAFTIFLPRHTVDADVVGDAGGEEQPGRPRDLTGAGTVLLVEDEGPVRQFGARALRNKGYNVLEAENGETALDLLRENADSIDLLITDVMMPGIDGPTLIRRVRETHADLKVIFISGYAEDTFRKRVDDGAVVHFLPKPFSLQELAGKVKEVMSGTAV